ncbi:MAG: DUF5612 domain-containing protein [Vicinamibacterales bacterium]|jgi:energy-converting hydrogenase B subunit Q|nr:hypothetical protein [Acidobacteriota bacterium]MDP7294667.1 DUF5612 domain-containing protein [Vicinamibacterales bacterium]MDP7472265.1 DUF5612 domain-containing protein [Vicinamibacterales bacterium]MDP7670787.1 DUF5612 domain-containing protein [Vicinamibacterales bacterium]HJO37794.1 DUF5612 domain-containing protein [Vicinamibacterales bacterium]
MADAHALVLKLADEPGSLHQVSKVLAGHGANVTSLEVVSHAPAVRRLSVEFTLDGSADPLLAELTALPVASAVESKSSSGAIYGKRIIIIGGGAQVGQVALGAISEADRHNIRGERISVDTIPLVGEESISGAVRAVVQLPRVHLLVLAGAIMGGEITAAVEDVRRQGLIVISLNMAGGVPDAADLVVTDPVQAGVMAVMAVADTAQFDILRQQNRKY